MITKYRILKLIKGEALDSKYKGKTLIALPFGPLHTAMVTYQHEYMIIKKNAKPLAIRTFNDQFGRDKKYRLWYYRWVGQTPKAVQSQSYNKEGAEKFLQAAREAKLI